ncbi:MAG: M24 family metallopeptidase [bacterium]
MLNRIGLLKKSLVSEGLDGLIVTSLTNIRYLSGFTGSNGMMLVTGSGAVFYTDFRYQEQIKTEVHGCAKRVLERDLYGSFPVDDLHKFFGRKRRPRIGVEENHLTLSRFRQLRSQLKMVQLVPVRDLVLELRRRKSRQELALMARAQAITERVFGEVVRMLKPGIREKDLANEIEFRFRRYGESAFPPIVASGENGAKPHGRASDRKIRTGDCITFDLGCRYQGYCSDMTRTVFLGRPDQELARVYEQVLRAQEEALAVIKPGVPGKLVDLAARDHLNRAGLGKFFGHSLGHGVGLEVHEQPVLAQTSKQTLKSGDVVTVEPGVYLPGKGGIRIEDMVLVNRNGYFNFTKAKKGLVVL